MADLSPEAQLVAVVGVDPARRVRCQAAGCGHGVYRRIHIVRQSHSLSVYGFACFERLFGHLRGIKPHFGSGAGRLLSDDERQLMLENTEALIAYFETEELQARESAKAKRSAASTSLPPKACSGSISVPRRGPSRFKLLTPAEFATVEVEAKAVFWKQHGCDPDMPGNRGLLLIEARDLYRSRHGWPGDANN